MRNGDRDIERAIEFTRSRVEIRFFDWRDEWNGIHRARPDMYILELNLSQESRTPVASRCDQGPVVGSFQVGDVAFRPHQAL